MLRYPQDSIEVAPPPLGSDIEGGLAEIRRRIGTIWPEIAAFRESQRHEWVEFLRSRSERITALGRLLDAYLDTLLKAYPGMVAHERYRVMLAELGLHHRTARKYVLRARRLDGRGGRYHDRAALRLVGDAGPAPQPQAKSDHPRHERAVDGREAIGCFEASPPPVRVSEPSRTSAEARPPVMIGRQLEINFEDAAEVVFERVSAAVRAAKSGRVAGVDLAEMLTRMADELARLGVE